MVEWEQAEAWRADRRGEVEQVDRQVDGDVRVCQTHERLRK